MGLVQRIRPARRSVRRRPAAEELHKTVKPDSLPSRQWPNERMAMPEQMRKGIHHNPGSILTLDIWPQGNLLFTES